MQRIIEIDMGLRDAARQQHPRARPVEVADELDRATRADPASIRPRPAPLMTRHNDSVHPARTGRTLHQGTGHQYAERSGAVPAP